MRYVKRGKCEQASVLLEELIGIYRGTPKARDVRYHYAYCKYKLGEYLSASYYFGEFARQYPRDTTVEEMNFMSAYCFYLLSDPWFLDPKYNYKAIDEMQLFIDTYPESFKREEANEIIMELRERLAKKSYEQAKLYFKTGQFKAAVTAFQLMVQEYPDSKFREESQFLLFKSAASLGDASIPTRKVQRYEEAMNFYKKFVDKFSESKFVREAENVFASVEKKHRTIIEEDKADDKKKKKK